MCNETICECGLDTCLNGGIFDQTTCSCQCPRNYYGLVCENFTACPFVLTCLNGKFNPTICNCECPSDYVGIRCEILISNITTTDSTTSTTITSTATIIGSTTSTTTALTTTSSPTTTSSSNNSSCQAINCSNGFTFNFETCACNCGGGFSGEKCELYNCNTTPIPDSFTLCPLLACGYPATDGACPFKCICGGTSPPPTTTVLTTTTGSNSCQPLGCKNGFLFDIKSCKCMCGSGFSGNLCETYECTTSPVPDSSQLCPLLACIDMIVNGVCPFKCLCEGKPRP